MSAKDFWTKTCRRWPCVTRYEWFGSDETPNPFPHFTFLVSPVNKSYRNVNVSRLQKKQKYSEQKSTLLVNFANAKKMIQVTKRLFLIKTCLSVAGTVSCTQITIPQKNPNPTSLYGVRLERPRAIPLRLPELFPSYLSRAKSSRRAKEVQRPILLSASRQLIQEYFKDGHLKNPLTRGPGQ